MTGVDGDESILDAMAFGRKIWKGTKVEEKKVVMKIRKQKRRERESKGNREREEGKKKRQKKEGTAKE
jgi:hypothetical protein